MSQISLLPKDLLIILIERERERERERETHTHKAQNKNLVWLIVSPVDFNTSLDCIKKKKKKIKKKSLLRIVSVCGLLGIMVRKLSW